MFYRGTHGILLFSPENLSGTKELAFILKTQPEMSITKKISANSILALKDALVAIYYRKKDLRQFIELTIENAAIVSTIDWTDNLKYESVSQLIDRMVKRQDLYQNDLLKLVQEVGNMNDFSHLV